MHMTNVSRLVLPMIIAVVLSCFMAFAEDRVHIAVSMNELDSARSVAIILDIQDALHGEEYSMEYASARNSGTRQLEDIEQLLRGEPDYLVVDAVKYLGMGLITEKAVESGSKVIFIEAAAEQDSEIHPLVEISCNLEQGIEDCIAELQAFCGDKAISILEIQGLGGSELTNRITTGLRNTIYNYDNMELAGVVDGGSNRQTAEDNVIEYIHSNGIENVQAIFAHGEEEAIGAMNAFIKLDINQRIPIVTLGGNSDICRAVRAGDILCCAYLPISYGEAIKDTIKSDRTGKEIPLQQYLATDTLITMETVDLTTAGY